MKGHILVLVDQRYRQQLQPQGMVLSLRKRGAKVSVFDQTQLASDAYACAVRDCDLVLARGRHPRLLAALDRARNQGVRVLDRPESIEWVRDKRLMTAAFRAADVNVPKTVLGAVEDVLASDLAYPLICKPVFGDNSRGLVVVHTPQELAAVTWPELGMLVQEYRPGNGVDLKLYVIDDVVCAVRKPSPISECRTNELGETPVTEELAGLARRCGDLFDLELFGVDCLETEEGITVLEVNEFPNCTAVPFASRRLARHVLARAATVDEQVSA